MQVSGLTLSTQNIVLWLDNTQILNTMFFKLIHYAFAL